MATAPGGVGQAPRGEPRQAPDDGAQALVETYAQSAQVMQAGAQMDAWRSRMNANHASNMARLHAQAAAGQAAHRARQEAFEATNQAWANRQAASERNTARFIDSIYERTTVEGGGATTYVPHGSEAYTDGYGAVIVVREGGDGPIGWRKMTPTYAAPD